MYELVVGLALVDTKKKKVLLQLRDNNPNITEPNKWVLPGGHVEANEALDDALRREVLEETGYTLQEFSLFLCFSDISKSKKTFYFYLAYYDANKDINCFEGQMILFKKFHEVKYLPSPPYLNHVLSVLEKSLNGDS